MGHKRQTVQWKVKIKKRAADIQIRKDELEYFEDRKKEAFKALEEAQTYINQGKLDRLLKLIIG